MTWEGKWRLSPAYDLNPVPYEENVRELTTWISEEGPDANLGIARRAAPFFALKKDQAEAIIVEVFRGLERVEEHSASTRYECTGHSCLFDSNSM